MRRFLLGVVLVVLARADALAQACNGMPSLTRHAAVGAVTLETGNDALFLGGGLTWGGSTLFGGVGAGVINFDDIDENALVVNGGIGYQIPTPQGSTLALCPVGSFAYQSGPDFEFLGDEIDLSAWTLQAGLLAGFPLPESSGLQLIPVVGGAVAYTKFTGEFGGYSESDSDSYFIVTGGLGLLMNRNVSIRPHVNIPLGLEDADPTFGIVLSFGLGRRQ